MAVPHDVIAVNVADIASRLGIIASDRTALLAPLTFDPSVVDIFSALVTGAAVVIVPQGVRRSPRRLEAVLRSQRVSVLMATPGLLSRFSVIVVRECILGPGSACRAVVLGGEPFPSVTTLRQWWPTDSRTRLYNIYGVTEVGRLCRAPVSAVSSPLLYIHGCQSLNLIACDASLCKVSRDAAFVSCTFLDVASSVDHLPVSLSWRLYSAISPIKGTLCCYIVILLER